MALIKISTDTTYEPVTLADTKEFLRIDSTNDDELIKSLITVSRRKAENYMKRTVIKSTYKMTMENFPGITGYIELMRPPISTASSDMVISFIKDTTILNDTTQVGSTIYAIDHERLPSVVYPIYDNEWPSCVTDTKKDAVRVQYKAGYTTVSEIPEEIKLWIKMDVSNIYENREPLIETQAMKNIYPLGHPFYMGLLDPYVILDMS